MGHKTPTRKNRKSFVELDPGIKKKCHKPKDAPKKLCSMKSDGNLLNFYDNDVMNDAASCLSIPDDNGLSLVDSDKDDAFGFVN